ncbi:MAG: ComEC/Rec2-related protein [Candidatus Woesebacteria bacterium GW2011_GWA1_33_30]|uniref:ComEC/Rec2-related protein n=1 Tax=Candidatus Woesebacteria bacterium GW2011_GWA2_33_28 TaxID=1618561 RepID=A0A0G0CU74_9BACT|nr:MAG: ComEC/Rec2-related protein [Candidatus Woesebacteria bacterium GW2011_GWA2_33_28]KKP47822.1 MAG: ComEC/Rec2-related protein [Candidatus Woesebacteria bacterium GW2011_GWA1_33_30]KKP49267.1 MAG: Competence protein ComEC [Microgenomates group bacterium GW2011_GWC1_33_32]KKP51634.1 MAG: ComEC/Rec2-related protein [Candidatus Woesebacteria bacterium GW2011_GWB1_33_38]KKP57633.1 MAG: ComEC/Rec2-related protein [Microgenomates group bacterium GW2011_GWD1_33_9]
MKFLSISFIVLTLLISLRFFSTQPVYKNGDFVRITSRVYTEPIIYDKQQYLKLQGLKIYLPKYPEITYGDRIIIQGVVGGNRLDNAKLIEINTENKNLLLKFRLKLISLYKSSLSEPYSSLVAGVTIGSKNMPAVFWEKLKSTGTAHIVVASGTNVTMLATFLISTLTYFFNRKHAVFMTLAGIFVYVVLSGFDAPIIRAGIMGSIAFLAQYKGRLVNSWRLLIYSAGIMLLIKPIWITDLGFILSFVATMSLMLFQKRINDKLKFVPNILREGLSTSLAAQIGVAPIIYATFGQFNLLSPIINALILWTIPYIMILGASGGIVGLIVPLVGRLILFILFPFLIWFTKILDLFS